MNLGDARFPQRQEQLLPGTEPRLSALELVHVRTSLWAPVAVIDSVKCAKKNLDEPWSK